MERAVTKKFFVFLARAREKYRRVNVWRRLKHAEATLYVLDDTIGSLPRAQDYTSLEEAVEHLGEAWNVLDDWGSSINLDKYDELIKRREQCYAARRQEMTT